MIDGDSGEWRQSLGSEAVGSTEWNGHGETGLWVERIGRIGWAAGHRALDVVAFVGKWQVQGWKHVEVLESWNRLTVL